MRCKNCGYINQNGGATCQECNAPLDGSMGVGQAPQGNQADNNDANLNKTIAGQDANLPSWDQPGTDSTAKSPTSDMDAEFQRISGNAAGQPNPAPLEAKSVKGTINPFENSQTSESFTLTEGNNPPNVPEASIAFSGDKVELNRDNVAPGNNSITSKCQAVIEQIDGEWYIVDQSSLKTTFVQAGKPIKLNDNDRILIGDKVFVFNKK